MPILTFDDVPLATQTQQPKSGVLTFEDVAPASFQESLGKKWDERMANVDVIAQREKAGDLNPFSGALQHVGQYAGAVNDIIGEEAKYLYNAIPESVKQGIAESAIGRAIGQTYRGNLVPGLESITGIKTSPADIVSTAGQTVGSGMEAIRSISPDTAANIEAAANIAGAVPIVQGAARGAQVLGKEANIALGRTIRPTAEQVKEIAIDYGYNPINKRIAEEQKVFEGSKQTAELLKDYADEQKISSYNIQREALGLKPILPEAPKEASPMLTYSPEASKRFVNYAQSFKNNSEWVKRIADEPAAAQIGSRLDDMASKGFSLDDAISLDKQLNQEISKSTYWDAAKRKYTPEGQQLLDLKSELRDIMFDISDKGYLVGNKDLINNYKFAIQNYRAQAGIQDIEDIISSADGRPNEAGYIRRKLMAIRDNKKLMATYTPEIQKEIKKAATLGVTKDLLNTLGGRGLSTLIGAGAGSVAGTGGTIIGGLAGLAEGRIARSMATKGAVSSANKIIDAMAAQSSLPSVRQTLTQRIGQNIPGLTQGAESVSQMFPDFIKEIMKMPPNEANRILRNLAVVSGGQAVVNQQQNSGAQ